MWSSNFSNKFALLFQCNSYSNNSILIILGSSLISFDLSFSWIETLNNNMLSKFIDLKYLHLSHANITHMGLDTFRYQVKLEFLNLSYNRLLEVDSVIFSHKFQYLNILNLEGNQLTKIENIIPEHFPKLRIFAISKNNFTCDYLLTYLRQWEPFASVQIVSDPTNYQTTVNGVDCNATKFSSAWNEFFSLPQNIILVFVSIFVGIGVILSVIVWYFCKQSTHKPRDQNVELNNTLRCGTNIRSGTVCSGTIYDATLHNEPIIDENEYSEITESTFDYDPYPYAVPVDETSPHHQADYANVPQQGCARNAPDSTQFNQPYATVDVSHRAH